MNILMHKANKSRERAEEIIFSLATGTLALSVTFKADLVTGSSVSVDLLKSAWVAFVVCIISRIAMLLADMYVRYDIAEHIHQGIRKKHIAVMATSALLFYGGFIRGIIDFTRFALANTA